ncbi:hypothetical protein [Micromonospora sp. WMMD1082]|uniref:hypothetical protein n=1 Tax=Micromonospora sp. WMMD1082 TaxID=3016104 RepID=UPI00241734E6|nr:hypothetical protein [Micromonospora sp. WMMD1082]MDG4795010.1 hypothetical protein [Micromonospora sp. WMMD1082]
MVGGRGAGRAPDGGLAAAHPRGPFTPAGSAGLSALAGGSATASLLWVRCDGVGQAPRRALFVAGTGAVGVSGPGGVPVCAPAGGNVDGVGARGRGWDGCR